MARNSSVNEEIVLGWKQLFLDLNVVDAFPTLKYADILKAAISQGSVISTLDFSGIQQLTDDAFFALKKVTQKTKLRETIKQVYCTGCIYITDFGVSCLAQSLPSLQEVRFEGCRLLTGSSLVHLQRHCPQLSTVDLSATSVTWMPSLGENVQLIVRGCPVLPRDKSSTAPDDAYTFENKLIVMLFTGCKFDIVEFLSRSDWSTIDISDQPKTASDNRRLAIRSGVQLDGIVGDFNVFMCHGNYSLLSLAFSPESMYVIVFDSAMENPQLYVMNRISAIRSAVMHCGIVIIGLVDDETEDDASPSLVELGEALDGYLKLQFNVLDNFLQQHAFDSELVKTNGFDEQRRYCRSLRASQGVCQFYIFSVNKQSKNVSLAWPTNTVADGKVHEYEEDEVVKVSPLMAARMKWTSELDRAKGLVSRLNKVDLSELRSMMRLPDSSQRTLDAMCLILTSGTETNYKAVIAKYSFLNDMLNLNLENVSDDVISSVREIMGDLLLEETREKNAPQALQIVTVIYAWVYAVYGYVNNCLINERAEEESKRRKERLKRRQSRNERNSKGPEAIIRVFRAINANLNDQRYSERKVRPAHVCALRGVEQFLKQVVDEKVVTLNWIRMKLKSAPVSEELKCMSEAALGTIINWLSIQGKVLRIKNVAVQPVILDIPWFINIMAELRREKSSCYSRNGSRCGSLPPDYLMITKKSLSSLCKGLSSDQMENLMHVLTGRGILVEAPRDAAVCREINYYTFLLASEKPFLRTGPQEGVESYSKFKEDYWPSAGSESWLDGDVHVGYYYSFTTGFPVNMVARIVSEWSRLGTVTLIYRSGALARVGALEIFLRHDIHGTLLYNGIAVEVRTTSGWDRDMADHTVVHEYISGALGKYLLVIEYIITQYSEIPVFVSMICQGSCAQRGFPGTIPIKELSRQLGIKVKCSDCTGDGVPQQLCVYYTGRQRSLPFHDWLAVRHNDKINTVSPYSKYFFQDNEDDSTVCRFCGSCIKGSLRLWEMESCISPSFIAHCAKFFDSSSTAKNQNLFELRGNILTVFSVDASFEKRNFPRALLLFPQPVHINGFTQLHVTVLEPGWAQVVVGQNFVSRMNANKLDTSRAFLIFDLQSGSIVSRDVRTKKFQQLPVTDAEPICAGDTLTIEVFSVKSIPVVAETQTNQAVEQTRIFLEIHLKKNGQTFHIGVVHIRSKIGVLVQADKGANPMQLVLDAPGYPSPRACDFPLGSSILYRNGNTWMLGCVTSTVGGHLGVTTPADAGPAKVLYFRPESPDITAVGQYSDGTSIAIGKDIVKNVGQLTNYIRATKMWPAPRALFRNLLDYAADHCTSLGLRVHESKWCTAYSNWPEVLEEAFEKLVTPRSRNHRLKQDLPMVLLPAGLNLSKLLNPFRKAAHDWAQQQVFFLCKGADWNTKDSYKRDTHFLDAKPVDVDEADIDSIVWDLSNIMMSYYCMEDRKNIIPFLEKTFPDSGAEGLEEMFIDGLSQLMLLYRSTFLLMLATYGNRAKLTSNRVKQKSRISLINRLVSASEVASTYAASLSTDANVDDDSAQLTGVCPTHSFILKKFWIQSMAEDQTSFELHHTMQYSPAVLFVEVNGVQVASNHFERILQTFTFLEGLNLSNCEVTSLAGIASCKQLRYVIVRGHLLEKLPDEMAVLASTLEHLDVSSGPLLRLPDFICEFGRLQSLNVSDTLLSELPSNIGKLSKLQSLNASRCLIGSLPDSFRHLRCLDSLHLNGLPLVGTTTSVNSVRNGGSELTRRQFDTFMTSFVALAQLNTQEIDVLWNRCVSPGEDSLTSQQTVQLNNLLLHRFPRFSDNYTTDDRYGGMPPQIFSLNKLRSLSLACQAIRFVPKEISWLPRLSKLLLNDNPYLEELSGDIGQCQLIVLNVNNCPLLRTPPKEILDKGMKTVIAYLKRLSQGSRAMYQTKLMIVGLGGVGKTSLIRALTSADSRAAGKEEGPPTITDGIDISNWSINRNGQTLTFNIWDFAGQTVYYNTHQFFLSPRGLYILAWNTRLGYEHAGLDFWLSSISCHCPDVPVFVVGTHCDEVVNSEIPHEQLQKRYPIITGFITVSSRTGEGIHELLESLVEVTMKLPYTGELVPEAWLNLERSILSKRNQTSLLDWNTVVKLAETAGIYGPEVNQAVSFLHDLGTLQHFGNELLRNRVIINPQWIVDVMACLVSVQNTVIERGRLKHKDIGIIWKSYPKELHSWLLKLTEVFDLTFPVPNEEENIVPCLLSLNEAQIDWPEPGSDGMRQTKAVYKFECLPKGLFNRVQVRLFEFSESSTMWKAGSLLKKNGHMALVKQIGEHQISVQAHGSRPENILIMVHEVIEGLISDSFTGIQYQYKIPCPHCLDAGVFRPTMFSSKTLRHAINSKALFLQCHKHFHALSVIEVQSSMLPQSAADFDVQLQRDVFELNAITDQLAFDLCFIYCEANAPSLDQETNVLHPRRVYDDLVSKNYRCWYVDDLSKRSVEEVASVIKSSKIALVFISNEFVSDPPCQRIFRFMRDSLRKEFVLAMVGSGREWLQSTIGAEVSGRVYVNLQNISTYENRITELYEHVEQKLNKLDTASKSVFISYCWLNSAMAVKAGQARSVPGAVSYGDPRELKQFLEDNEISCWLDIDQVGRMGLFEDIAEGMKNSKVVIAFISDEYAKSENCKMEFRFGHVSLKKPFILAVVGSGFEWESTEIGMLSLGYPKLNFQETSDVTRRQLLADVKEKLELLDDNPSKPSTDGLDQQEKEKEFKELYEVVQRKFLRQLTAYIDDLEAYPRLIVFDVLSMPEDDPEGDSAQNKDAIVRGDEPTMQSCANLETIQSLPLCVKTLCEFDGGWHCVEEGIPIAMETATALLWDLTAPYMARIMSIIRHSSVDLQLFKTSDADKLLKALQANAGPDSLSKVRPVYIALRKFVTLKNIRGQHGCLKRCYLTTGKCVWLCQQHQSLPWVTVLPEAGPSTNVDDLPSSLETELLRILKQLTSQQTISPNIEETPETARQPLKSARPSRAASRITVQERNKTTLSEHRPSLDFGTRTPRSRSTIQRPGTRLQPESEDQGAPRSRSPMQRPGTRQMQPEIEDQGYDFKNPVASRVTLAGLLANGQVTAAEQTSKACIIL